MWQVLQVVIDDFSEKLQMMFQWKSLLDDEKWTEMNLLMGPQSQLNNNNNKERYSITNLDRFHLTANHITMISSPQRLHRLRGIEINAIRLVVISLTVQ